MLYLFFPDEMWRLPDDIRKEQEVKRCILKRYSPDTIVRIEDEYGNIIDTTEISNIFNYESVV